MIQIFFLDEKGDWGKEGEWVEIENLYWFFKNGVESFDGTTWDGHKYTFKVLVDGVQVYRKERLVQLHHQFKDGSTVMRAQREIRDYNQMEIFLDETKVNPPLPKDVQWLACTEESKHFVRVSA